MRFDGDPKVYIDGDGQTINVTDGQPDMDEGLENAVLLSLLTERGWWGNAVSKDDEKYTSDFCSLARKTLTNQTRLDAESYAKTALAWMVKDGVARSVSVSATIPQVGMLALAVTIEQPQRTTTIRFQINWAEMSVRLEAA